MPSDIRGFPHRFPVRDGDGRSLRYRLAVLGARSYVRLLAGRRLRISGVDNIPESGPLLVVANHISNLDPMVVGGFFPRTLFAMAKREMYANRLAAWFLAGVNCIPVNRGGADRRAVTRALEALGRGGRLLIFVEGTRSRDGSMQRAEPGVAFLARRSGAAILPVAITGTDGREPRRGWRRRAAAMRYGAPFTIDVSGPRDDRTTADEIALRIAALLPADRRGVYAADAQPGTVTSAAGSTGAATPG